MDDLIDIQGLGYISWWPLAIGWWVLIILLSTLIIISTIFLVKRYKYKNSWRYIAYKNLHKLQQQLSNTEPKIIMQDFSIEMRKIAMLSTQRQACASLTGKEWLDWLHKHDPREFNWLQNGQLLLTAQYQQNILDVDVTTIKKLIDAAKKWVNK